MDAIRKKSSGLGCLGALLVVVFIIIFFLPALNSSVLILAAIIVGLAILGLIFPTFFDFILSLADAYLKIVLLLILAVLPSVLFLWLYKASSAWSPWLQTLILILSGALLVTGIWLLLLEKNRVWLLKKSREFKWTSEFGIMVPLAYVYNMIWFAVLFFGSLTYFLVEQEWLAWVGPAGQQMTLEKINDFYFWHLVNTLPFKITETVHWNAPATYENPGIGWMLVLFKSAAIGPVIAAFTWYWRDFGKPNQSQSSGKPAKDKPKKRTIKKTVKN